MNDTLAYPLPTAETAENLSRNAVTNDLADLAERHWESPIDKAARNPQSLRMAINAMCCQCMGEVPGWRIEVRNCTAPHCALWNTRPYQTGETGEPEPALAGARACEA